MSSPILQFGESERAARARAIVDGFIRQMEAGETVSDQSLVAAHPDLMPELGAELRRQLEIFRHKGERPEKRRTVAADTVVAYESGSGSSGLQIRCPNCHEIMHIAADTRLTDLICSACGSHFSLVDNEQNTWMAPSLSTMGRFELVERLGIGGFGTVWKARDRELDRTVAIKLPRQGGMSPADQEKFFREARAAAQLRHPNIVSVHEVGRDGDSVYIVSDFVRGVTLSDWLTGQRLTTREAARLCAQIADALHHAHEQGVVHRDLKPANVIIDDGGEPHLMDFGLARRDVGEVTITMDGQVIGTPAYMSPEQASGEGHAADRRTDVYSLGVVLFQCLTGELPFRGNARMLVHQVLNDPPPGPRKFNANIPKDLETITLKCLEKDPARRYPTAHELATEVRRFLAGEPIHARPAGPIERGLRWAKRKPMMATTAALIVLLAIGGPLTAIFIEHQRKMLADKIVERNNLIQGYALQKQQAVGKINELTRQLSVWEGRANPWEFWPPRQEESERQSAIADVLDSSGKTLAAELRAGKFQNDMRLRGYLGLAALADSAARAPEARTYYEAARDHLLAMANSGALSPNHARALAECYVHLARLSANQDKAAAIEQLQLATEIYRRLAATPETQATYQFALLETELAAAMLAGLASGDERYLTRVAMIHRSLPGLWPQDPDSLYHLACYLTRREPILAAVPDPEMPADASAGVTAPPD